MRLHNTNREPYSQALNVCGFCILQFNQTPPLWCKKEICNPEEKAEISTTVATCTLTSFQRSQSVQVTEDYVVGNRNQDQIQKGIYCIIRQMHSLVCVSVRLEMRVFSSYGITSAASKKTFYEAWTMYCLTFTEAYQCIGINVVLQLVTIVLLCVMTYYFNFFS